MRALRVTLIVIGVFQVFFGVVFLVAPGIAAGVLHLSPAAPPWATWLLAMMAARFLGFGYGMFLAARDPHRHIAWIDAMVIIQAIDWIATLTVLAAGTLTLAQVSTAALAPPLFVAALLALHPRRRGSAARDQARRA